MATAYDIWVQKVLGGTKSLIKAIGEFGSSEEIYKICKSEDPLPLCLNKVAKEKFSSYSLSDASSVLDVCHEHNWSVISYSDDLYPKELLQISDFPAVIFCDGDTTLLSASHKIAVVGTRKPSDTGRSVAYKSGLSLSAAGVCLVSGGAFGIDNCAHEGAMLGGNGTISVLGCGLGSDYVNKIPYSADRIRKHGLMITEMFPFEKPGRYTFPKRNRILSGLCESCLVIECSEKSGALITADLALKQNKKVFYITPDVLRFAGQKHLVDMDATAVLTMSDVFGKNCNDLNKSRLYSDLHSDGLEGRTFLLEGCLSESEYSAYHRSGTDNRNTKKSNSQKINSPISVDNDPKSDISFIAEISVNAYLGDTEKLILSCLSDNPVYPDEIADKTGLDIVTVTVSLTNLEIDGLIKMNSGNSVTLK